MFTTARFFILLGILFLVIGGLLYLAARSGILPGRLPGDIRIERGNFSCVIALGTSLLLSILLTLLLNLLARLMK